MINVSDYPKKIYSQHGEDGVVEKIFEVLNVKASSAVEFGAWDGIAMSNVFNLVMKGSGCVYIECDDVKYKDLVTNMSMFPKVYCVKSKVSLEKDETLDGILGNSPVPKDFDILSIDIDGNDYHVWKSLVNYNPKVVVVEYNTNFKGYECIQYDPSHFWNGTSFYGASAKAFEKLGKEKGYDLIGIIEAGNLFFVRSELNGGKFWILDLDKVNYSSPRHKPMTSEQEKKIIKV